MFNDNIGRGMGYWSKKYDEVWNDLDLTLNEKQAKCDKLLDLEDEWLSKTVNNSSVSPILVAFLVFFVWMALGILLLMSDSPGTWG